jgi:8-oxo-dGTP pyrophosphatase MutT (NUDIX family)
MSASIGPVTRDFTVAVFVVHKGGVLLHRHPKLGRWLPPGGHIEPHELPDDAALREVREEAGIDIELIGDRGLPQDFPDQPRQLLRPAGIQLESISPGHEHIDLVYVARVAGSGSLAAWPRVAEGFRWVLPDELEALAVTEEIVAWCGRAVALTSMGTA